MDKFTEFVVIDFTFTWFSGFFLICKNVIIEFYVSSSEAEHSTNYKFLDFLTMITKSLKKS